MQFVANNWFLFVGLFFVLFLLAWGPLRQLMYGIHTVSIAEAVRLVNHEQAIIVDVREVEEFRGGHIPKAINLPLSKLRSGLTQLDKHKARPVVVCCRTSQRSARAAVLLRQHQFANVQVLAGGIIGWQGENLPVEK
jgi:rhodanese-related sulfurtransferase